MEDKPQPLKLHIEINDKDIGVYEQVIRFENFKSLLNFCLEQVKEKKK